MEYFTSKDFYGNFMGFHVKYSIEFQWNSMEFDEVPWKLL